MAAPNVDNQQQAVPEIEVTRVRRRTATHDDSSSYDDDSMLDAPEDENIFDDNDQCLVDNPLIRLRPDEVERKAKRFVRTHGLHNQEETFIKAGKILRDPEAWEAVPNLSLDEKEVLFNETRGGFWKQPKELRVTIITLCVAAVVQGWNQTASNGANLNWPKQLGLLAFDGCDPIGEILNTLPRCVHVRLGYPLTNIRKRCLDLRYSERCALPLRQSYRVLAK